MRLTPRKKIILRILVIRFRLDIFNIGIILLFVNGRKAGGEVPGALLCCRRRGAGFMLRVDDQNIYFLNQIYANAALKWVYRP